MEVFVATILFRSETETDAKSVIGSTLEEVKNKVYVLREKFKQDCFDEDDEDYDESEGENYINAWSNNFFLEFSADIESQIIGEYREEHCEECDDFSETNGIFEVQPCTECGNFIVPCSICPIDTDNYRPCDTCPLNKECERLNLGHNMSGIELVTSKYPLFEGARHYFSRLCCDNGADCEEKAYRLDIDVDGTMGLSELQKMKYKSIYEVECEGFIYFDLGTMHDEPQWTNFDDLTWSEIVYIIKQIEGID